MDPFSFATAFATVVSLIGQFRAERGAAKQADFNEFLAWLVETDHEGLKALIEGNEKTLIGIRELLNEQHDTLMQRLDLLDGTLAHYASALPGFSDVSVGLKPRAVLSNQALSILKQFESSGASKVLENENRVGTSLLYLDANGEVKVDTPRFLEDDLKTLVEVGLLRHDYNSRGRNLYVFTRAASDLVRSANS